MVMMICLSQTKSSQQQEQISKILYETMVNEKFKLTDIGFHNLVIHIMIALLRLKEKEQQNHYDYDDSIKKTKEYENEINSCITWIFGFGYVRCLPGRCFG